jgi:hypothetical protein
VTSPGDVVTVSALAPGPASFEDVALFAFVGAVPATVPVDNPFLGGGPTPLSVVAFAVFPAQSPIVWSNLSSNLQFDSEEQTYQFLSPTDAQAHLAIADSSGATTITVAIANIAPSVNCASLFTGPTFPLVQTLAANATLSLLIAPNGTGSGSCVLTATDSAAHTASISVFINSVSGSIR